MRASWDGTGRLTQLEILKDANVSDNQLTRNVLSALKAGFGIRLEVTGLHIFRESGEFAPAAAAGDGEQAAAAAGTEPVQPAPERGGGPTNGNGAAAPTVNGYHGNGSLAPVIAGAGPASGNGAHARANGNGGHAAANGAANGAHVVAPLPTAAATPGSGNGRVPHGPSLERLDLERQAGSLRCHVILALGDRRLSAIAEVPDTAGVEAELAARVTMDALRAGCLTTARLEGVGYTTIGGVTYVVAAVREAAATAQRACAAPLVGGAARSAVAAVLNVVGPLDAAQRKPAGP